ncbi:MAG TPA: DUF5777 family beta-barrel protein [Phnomibacter sp.]|nr:DUF5777 family beta-barrel protein [Phnomibacter sp.]
MPIRLFFPLKRLLVVPALFAVCIAHAQDSSLLIDNLLVDSVAKPKVTGAFKSTRVIMAHSIEMLKPHNLDVRILHRFGSMDQGIEQFFGLDQAKTRLGMDYGLLSWCAIGVGRSTYRKEVDMFAKFRLLQQGKGKGSMPFSVLLATGMTILTGDIDQPDFNTSKRFAYYAQLLVGRKFSEAISLQLIPTVLHRNYVFDPSEENTIAALGIGGRIKLSKRIAFTGDYHYVFGGHPPGFFDPIGFGFDIETGGHVFQLHFSNSVGMNERAYLVETTDEFFKGEIRFGFNISRMFQMGGKGKKY